MPTAKCSASLVFLWFRPDLPREQAREYWAGPHSQLVGRSPGFLEYRQHHFAADSRGSWPALAGVETTIPDQRRIDGMPEVTFAHVWSPLAGRKQSKKIHQDERNVFARTILQLTGPGGGRRFRTGYQEKVGARTVILLRRRDGVDAKTFTSFVHTELGPALDRAAGVVDLRTYTFVPFNEKHWNTPDVAHDYPAGQQFHAAIVLGAGDSATLQQALSRTSDQLSGALREHCAAIHAYDVEQTYDYVRDGRPAFPQVKPERKPRLQPVVRTDIQPMPARAKQTASPAPFPPARLVPLSGTEPEDAIVDDQGRVIVGVADGRILRIDVHHAVEETLGTTGGRPLGLELLDDGQILVCDAHHGLLRLDPKTGEVITLVRLVDDVPLRFCSNVAAASDGTLWFTESTDRYDYEQFAGALLEHRPSGRLFRRDPDGTVTVVRRDLHFANGVALTSDEKGVLFAETGAARISRYDIATDTVTVVADNLPGYPDNMSPVRDGRFWVAMVARDPMLEKLATVSPLLRKAIWKIPDKLLPAAPGTTWVMAFDEHGRQLADFQESRQDFQLATGVAEHAGQLFLASPRGRDLLVLDLPSQS